MRSPGRPRVAGREEQQRFWQAITRGLSSEEAAVSCGVSPPVGGRWFREGGGMPPISLAPSLTWDQDAEMAQHAQLKVSPVRSAHPTCGPESAQRRT